MMDQKKFTIGVDFGTDSVRSVIVNTKNGKEVASHVFYYPQWREGKFCDPAINQFRQHPQDYIDGLIETITKSLENSPKGTSESIVAISVDTTGSTPVAVDKEGVPLALLPEFSENPNAMFVLWKDHTAVKEADEINELARSWGGIDYTKYEGGVYSSEWFWAKILHILREDPVVAESAFSWVEHCDWIPALLTGKTNPLRIKRSRCAAGHKAMWHTEWGGLPSEEFLVKLDPLLKGLRERLYHDTYASDEKVGTISSDWAEKLGVPKDTVIGVGAFDAHLGAVGGEIKPYYLSKVMGTSTCDMLISSEEETSDKLVRGICGQVDGSISPGMIGLEAGQSAFGDIYAWFKNVLMWPLENILSQSGIIENTIADRIKQEIDKQIIPQLSRKASEIPIDVSGPLALDWMNGRRTPDANQNLKGAIMNLTLGSDAPKIFRALVEATAFGSRRIIDRFREEGVRIDGVIALGGVAKKSPFVMQIVADVLNMPILVARSEQTCALGSAMAASVVGGVHASFHEAQEKMGAGFEYEYKPVPENARIYDMLYEKYLDFGNFVEKQTNKQ